MAAVDDSFMIPDNATLERFYQITSGGEPQNITDWILHSEWRNADGSLALGLTIGNGLVLVDPVNGLWKKLIQPSDLRGLSLVSYDVLAIPPLVAGGAPKVYRPVVGTITITPGSTRSGIF